MTLLQHEEKKKLDQLRKELEEERQLAELQRMQEEATGRKRVEKLDWMYATPSAQDGTSALGGTRMDEKAMEDYLLGKRRVDDVLKAGEKNVSAKGQNAKESGLILCRLQIGAQSKDFIAVQNANSAMDIAAKIREDPLLAIKRQEQAAYQAMMNNPALRKKMKELKEKRSESKEERKERKRREKDEKRRRDREEDRSRTPPPRRYEDRRGDDYDRRRRSDPYEERRPRSDHHDDHHRRRDPYDRRSPSPRRSDRCCDERSRRDGYDHRGRPASGGRLSPPRHTPMSSSSGPSRPSALDLDAAPTHARGDTSSRAARLAQMAADAEQHSSSRLQSLERRRVEEEEQLKREEAERKRADATGGGVRNERLAMGSLELGDVLGRRGGKGLQRDEW